MISFHPAHMFINSPFIKFLNFPQLQCAFYFLLGLLLLLQIVSGVQCSFREFGHKGKQGRYEQREEQDAVTSSFFHSSDACVHHIMLLKNAKKKVIFSKILKMTRSSSFTCLRLSSRELLLTWLAKHNRVGQILIFSPGPWSSWALLPLYHGPFGGRHPVSQFRTGMMSPRPQRPLHSYSSEVSPSWDIG